MARITRRRCVQMRGNDARRLEVLVVAENAFRRQPSEDAVEVALVAGEESMCAR